MIPEDKGKKYKRKNDTASDVLVHLKFLISCYQS